MTSTNAQSTHGQVYKNHRVVFQMNSNDPESQKALMNNLQNLKKAWGANVEIEVVTFGPGIELVMTEKSAAAEGIAEMIKNGVIFVACENTMAKKNITKEELIENVGTVPSGVAEVIIKQEQGWSYIKGGI
ncbi:MULTISPECIES: DsrE family protein [unclassified Flavobacterium]|jgi:intracellular sulfur oxidation DsrE/DsrF family protein|uniref:DsrE family protein n=1 Tax=unclassified Flavobacterium TaxID=196869 RepID=UPI0025B88C7A|nr:MULTISPECIES: DsrE family protein [unclassified Flavobacterium]